VPGLDWLTARPVAHRGLHGAGAGVIENTPSAFAAAVAANYAIECDLQISADGEAMVHHDDALGRLTEGSGRLDALTGADTAPVQSSNWTLWLIASPLIMTASYGAVRVLMAVLTQWRDGIFANSGITVIIIIVVHHVMFDRHLTVRPTYRRSAAGARGSAATDKPVCCNAFWTATHAVMQRFADSREGCVGAVRRFAGARSLAPRACDDLAPSCEECER